MPSLKENKPVLDEHIPIHLDGEMRNTAENFITWLRNNKMNPVWSSAYTWKANYKGETICSVQMPLFGRFKNTWLVSPHLFRMDAYKTIIEAENLKNIIFDNIKFCVFTKGQSGVGCNPRRICVGGESGTVLGEKMKGLCRPATCWSFTRLTDPDDEALEKVKRLIMLERKARDEKAPIIEIFKQASDANSENSNKLMLEYKNTKPKFTDLIAKLLEGNNLKNAVAFAEWLCENKLSVNKDSKIIYKGETLCSVNCGIHYWNNTWVKNAWRINFDIHKSDIPDFGEDMRKTIWANMRKCNDCCGCMPGRNVIACGKMFEKACQYGFSFWNPDNKELECVKQLILSKI